MTKRVLAMIITLIIAITGTIPVNAASFDYSVEKGSVLGSGTKTDTTHASTIVMLLFELISDKIIELCELKFNIKFNVIIV